MIYFDNASTTRLNKDVFDTYQLLLNKYFANPSGTHLLAREVARLQDKSRSEILSLLNYKDGQVIFTSSATEANNLLLIGLFLQYKNRGKQIITTPFEHPSVRNTLLYLEEVHGAKISYVKLDEKGKIDLNSFKKLLSEETVIVTIMAVNNEVGTVLNLDEIKALIKSYPKIIFHSDVTQAITKHPCDFSKLDAFSFSFHKIHGLKGSGIIVMRSSLKLMPLFHGGSQEAGMRAGTSNAPVNIVSAKTLRLALENAEISLKKVSALSKRLRDFLASKPDYFHIISPAENPYIVTLVTLKKKASVILNALENAGIIVGTTSSCSAKIDAYNHSVFVLTNNLNWANNALRVSFSSDNTAEEIDVFYKTLIKILEE